jgi:hypothetical protein
MMRTKTYPVALSAVRRAVLVFCCCCSATCQNVRSSRDSYFPLSVGNSWVYSVRGHSQSKTITWKVTQSEIMRGNPMFHLWQTPAQDDEPLSLSEEETGIVEAGSERFLLKYPLSTGERWSVKSQSLRAPGKSDTFEVTSAEEACSVGGHSFAHCATVREIDEANNVASLTTYARGVGPVKYVYFKGSHSEDIDTTLTIKSWQVH